MKEDFVYLFLDWNRCSQYTLWTIIFASQWKRASDNTWTNQNLRYKSQNQVEICGKRQREPCRWKRVQLWILVNLQKNTERSVKTRRNVQNIRFCKESTSRWGVYLSWKWMSLCLVALKSYVNLPDLAAWEHGWEVVESLIVPCEVLLVRNHSTSSGSRLVRLLPVIVIVTVNFYAENISEKIHFIQIWQPKHGNRPYKVWFQTFIVCSI